MEYLKYSSPKIYFQASSNDLTTAFVLLIIATGSMTAAHFVTAVEPVTPTGFPEAVPQALEGRNDCLLCHGATQPSHTLRQFDVNQC